MEQRGILLETNGRQAVVLTPQGEFIRIAADRGWQVGEEVTFSRSAVVVPAPRRRWLTLVAAAAAVLVLALGAAFYVGPLTAEAAVATVTVDINPSLELDVSAQATVVGATALNADGARVLHELTYRKRPVDQVVADITDIAIRDGFLDPTAQDALVLIAAEPRRGKALPTAVAAQIEEKARAQAQQVLARHSQGKAVGAHVTVVEADDSVRQLAEQEHISVGRAAAVKALEQMGIHVNPQDLSTKSVRELVREEAQKAGLSPGEVVSQLEKELHDLLGPGQGGGRGKPGDGKSGGGQSDDGKSGGGQSDDGKSGGGKADDGRSGGGKSGGGRSDDGKAGDGKSGRGRAGGEGSGPAQPGEGQEDKGRERDKNNKGPGQGQNSGQGQGGFGNSVGGLRAGDGGGRNRGDGGGDRGGGRDDRRSDQP